MISKKTKTDADKDADEMWNYFEEEAKKRGVKYVPLMKVTLKSEKLSFRKKNPKRKANLKKIKNLKNAIFIPTDMPNADFRVENKYSKLEDCDYWCIELNPKKMYAKYLSDLLNQPIPKITMMMATDLDRMSRKNLDKVQIFDHSLEQQKQFIETSKNLEKIAEATKTKRERMIYSPKKLEIDDIISEIPNLKFQKLLEDEESEIHEYKTSIRWSTKENRQVSHLIDVALKTIVAFLNTSGGHLVIGVDPKKKLIGIEIDQFESTDAWQLYFVDKISKKLDATFIGKYIKINTKKYDKKTVAIVQCVKIPKEEQASLDQKIYVREGPRTRELTPKEVASWTIRKMKS